MAIDAVNARGSVHARLDTLDHDAKVRGKGGFWSLQAVPKKRTQLLERGGRKEDSEPLRNENKKSSGDERRCAVCSLQVALQARSQPGRKPPRLSLSLGMQEQVWLPRPLRFRVASSISSRPTANALITTDSARDQKSRLRDLP
jgi:hypothetical protein